jgi:hypothetical protein
LASGAPLILESDGFNISLGTGIVNNGGALEFDTTIGYNFSNPLSINGLAMQVPYSLGNLNSGTAQWVHLGTLTIAQGGYSAYFKIVFNNGYNANINENIELFIRFKTSNNNSVNSYGFAADSSFYTTGLNTSIASGDVIFIGNAAGISATAYDLYIYFPAFTGQGSYYMVETTGIWVNNLLVESPSGTANSSTVLLPNFQHNITSPLFTAHNTLDNGSGLATLTTLNLVNVLDAQYINISNTLINNGGALDVNIDNTYIIQNSGVLSINLTENYIWTGNHTFPNSIYDFDAALSIAYLQMIIGIQAKPSGAGMDLSGTFTAGSSIGGTFTPSQNFVYVIINTIQNTGTNLIVQLEDLTTGAYLECISPPNMPNTTTLSKVFLCQSQVSTSNTYQFHINGGFNGTLVWNATANY